MYTKSNNPQENHLGLPNKLGHEFHIINPSPWPLASSASCALLLGSLAALIHGVHFSIILVLMGLIALGFCAFRWWQDVFHEGQDGCHTPVVRNGLRYGMIFFIGSEIFLFATFFSSLFFYWLKPLHYTDELFKTVLNLWPPSGIETVHPWNMPLLNTLILLLSGTAVTWAHAAAAENKKQETARALFIATGLGVCFSIIQFFEFKDAPFSIGSNEIQLSTIYPSNFFILTGFHGLHVLVGSAFLLVCAFRAKNGSVDGNSLSLGFAAWYWHFVDVVWLALFVFLYLFAS